jgi:hypothetical protein
VALNPLPGTNDSSILSFIGSAPGLAVTTRKGLAGCLTLLAGRVAADSSASNDSIDRMLHRRLP